MLGAAHDVPDKLAADLARAGISADDLSEQQLEYLVEMKRETLNLGGFRRVYPSRQGDD